MSNPLRTRFCTVQQSDLPKLTVKVNRVFRIVEEAGGDVLNTDYNVVGLTSVLNIIYQVPSELVDEVAEHIKARPGEFRAAQEASEPVAEPAQADDADAHEGGGDSVGPTSSVGSSGGGSPA